MMMYSDKPDGGACQLMDQLFDKTIANEPLSIEEQSAFRDHLEHCERCRNAQRLVNALPRFADAAMDEDMDGNILSVLDELRVRRQHETKGRFQWAGIAIAASLAALTVLGVWMANAPEDRAAISVAVRPCIPSSSTELVSGVFMIRCAGTEAGTIINDGAVQVSLTRGTVALSVDPRREAKKPVSVRTPKGEVRVKGTLFSVHVDSSDEQVEVFRGIVEVIPREEREAAFQVTAGHGATAKDRLEFELCHPATQKLAELLDSTTGTRLDEASAIVERAKGGVEEVDSAVTAESEVRSSRGAPLSKAGTSMEALIEDARSCLLSREWECAASRYERVIKVYAHRSESTAVLISLAKLEHRHLNSPRRALAHYNTYLKKAPDGPLAEEALFGVAKTCRSLGLKDEEKKALQKFAAKHPHSSLMVTVQNRLAQLD